MKISPSAPLGGGEGASYPPSHLHWLTANHCLLSTDYPLTAGPYSLRLVPYQISYQVSAIRHQLWPPQTGAYFCRPLTLDKGGQATITRRPSTFFSLSAPCALRSAPCFSTINALSFVPM